MSFNRYFQDELIALRELGREYSQRNPGLAPFLDTPGRDPDVERILEGFAFLTGRLRQKLDDELPEITHALFNLLWPNYLRPIPACSVIRYQPTGTLSGTMNIPRGTLVESAKIGGTPCTFRTAYETEILPIQLVEQSMLEKDGRAILALRFAVLGSGLENISLDSLRFFFTGEKAIAHTLYFTITEKVKEIRMVLRDAVLKEHVTARLTPDAIRPVGFREDEGLYPYPSNTFPGYRILQEYFCFPEKFLFAEVSGLQKGLSRETLRNFPGIAEFSLHFVLDEMPENYESFQTKNIQLFCTPVVNLFPMDATPLTVDTKQTEYRIVPDPSEPDNFSVYSVDKVQTFGGSGGGYQTYLPFESFEHDVTPGAAMAYYRLHLRTSMRDDATETYISLVHTPSKFSQKVEVSQYRETVSLTLTCTNRFLPRELGVGDICVHTDNTPGAVAFSNIIPVTPPYTPPLEGDILWRLLSNMSLNYIPLTDVRALRAIIATYDFRALHDRHRARVLGQTLQGMVKVECEETDRIYKGLPLRGARTRLTMNQRNFSCEGDMYLFGAVLNEFLALYATVNSFHQLIVVEEKRGEQYQWPARLGSQPLT